jgi:hypothetical protein
MPGYKGHLVGGAVTFGLMVYAINSAGHSVTLAQALPWAGSTLAGCLFPDIDVKSKGQNFFYKVLIVVLIALLVGGYQRSFVAVSVASLVPMVVRHRGLFHRLWFIVGFPFFLALVLGSYYPMYQPGIYSNTFFFVVGAISHLWLDLGFKRMFLS